MVPITRVLMFRVVSWRTEPAPSGKRVFFFRVILKLSFQILKTARYKIPRCANKALFFKYTKWL